MEVAGDASSSGAVFRWRPAGGESPARWVWQARRDGAWTLRVLAAETLQWSPAAEALPDAVALYALDRAGNLSEPVVFERR